MNTMSAQPTPSAHALAVRVEQLVHDLRRLEEEVRSIEKLVYHRSSAMMEANAAIDRVRALEARAGRTDEKFASIETGIRVRKEDRDAHTAIWRWLLILLISSIPVGITLFQLLSARP